MDSLQSIDWIITVGVISITLLIGFFSGRLKDGSADEYIVNSRNMGLFTFVAVNVTTWYGGILGIGEYSYRYGISSWFTQGLPYYIFALIFAFLFAGKVRATGLLSIPEKIEVEYGRKVAMVASILIFIITSPAPYLLTAAQIISTVFDVGLEIPLFLIPVALITHLSLKGFKSNIKVDVFLFLFMFLGFITAVVYLLINYGGVSFLQENLPATHLTPTGGASYFYMLVWYLVAAWTIADPGFHQRVYATKDEGVAKRGIIISVVLWFVFDLFSNASGLFSRAILPDLADPVTAFPALARDILPTGIKGLFLVSLFATVYTTLNSFTFLSGITFSNDILKKLVVSDLYDMRLFTAAGMVIATTIAILLSLVFRSIVDIWYYIGSLFVPSLIFLVAGSYFPKLKLRSNITLAQVIFVPLVGLVWFLFRNKLFADTILAEVEPMLIGIVGGSLFYLSTTVKRHP
jgi:SSS family solute:Na+ symporter